MFILIYIDADIVSHLSVLHVIFFCQNNMLHEHTATARESSHYLNVQKLLWDSGVFMHNLLDPSKFINWTNMNLLPLKTIILYTFIKVCERYSYRSVILFDYKYISCQAIRQGPYISCLSLKKTGFDQQSVVNVFIYLCCI